MLDGRDLDAVLDQRRAQHGLADQARIGRDVHRVLEIDAPKRDTGVFRRGPQRHVDLLAIVQSDTGRTDGGLEGALSQHGHFLNLL